MATEAPPPEAPAPPASTAAAQGAAAASDDLPERRHERTRSTRLVVIFLGGCATLVAPFLAVASRPVTVAGLPLAWVYLFLTWAVLIGLTALTVRDRGED